jgi:hypothetical protein
MSDRPMRIVGYRQLQRNNMSLTPLIPAIINSEPGPFFCPLLFRGKQCEPAPFNFNFRPL